jgi:hypothetical protein
MFVLLRDGNTAETRQRPGSDFDNLARNKKWRRLGRNFCSHDSLDILDLILIHRDGTLPSSHYVDNTRDLQNRQTEFCVKLNKYVPAKQGQLDKRTSARPAPNLAVEWQ